MKSDNTLTVNSRRRPLNSHKRLRVETAKTVQQMRTHAKIKRAESTNQGPREKNSEGVKSASVAVPTAEKGTLATPGKPPSKFRKRQINKSWLPTHVYHAKRAHMTPPTEPLWRHAIPLTPTDKCYRATHRAVSCRGCVVWDMSYMSTIAVEGAEASLLGLLRGLGVEESMLAGKSGGKWRRGTRGWEGWISERDGEKRTMARARVIWDVPVIEIGNGGGGHAEGKKKTRKMLLRVHPSAFLQVWTELLKISKVQRPPVIVEDLRFEIGSIELIGPGSTEALICALRPQVEKEKIPGDGPDAKPENKPETIWPLLCEVTNPASLPPNALLGFEISDPRLHHPPQTVKSDISSVALLQILATWPPDASQTSFAILDRKARFNACKLLSSQKSINRRKGDALAGAYPDPLPDDPRIPILLAASPAPSQGGQGSWTVLLPWKTVLPVWNSLMHYPLTTGENPRFGCLQEQRQIAFEQGVPWFPGDFPGTKAGWEWELMEREKRKAEWEKRPKGKRVAWESLDLGGEKKGEVGVGWACDWERLFQGPTSPSALPLDPASISNTAAPHPSSAPPPTPQEPSSQDPPSPPFNIHHVPSPFPTNSATPTALTTISISIISRGNPTTCARIYRLPTTSPTLREAWIAQTKMSKPSKKTTSHFHPSRAALPQETPSHIRIQHLAAELLAPPPPKSSIPQTGATTTDDTYPHVPGEEDLIGFVTTGNFDLGQGRARAIGCVALARMGENIRGDSKDLGQNMIGINESQTRAKKDDATNPAKLCIVRNAGQSLGRLARWEFI